MNIKENPGDLQRVVHWNFVSISSHITTLSQSWLNCFKL